MGKIDDMREWLATDASPEERMAVERRLNPPGGALAALNAVAITGPQMRAAIAAIQHIQARSEEDGIEHGRLLAMFAKEHGFTPAAYAGPALHARAIAMDSWCQRYDPYGQTDVDAFFEAAARCPLIETEHGVAFDPDTFAELATFIAELPF